MDRSAKLSQQVPNCNSYIPCFLINSALSQSQFLPKHLTKLCQRRPRTLLLTQSHQTSPQHTTTASLSSSKPSFRSPYQQRQDRQSPQSPQTTQPASSNPTQKVISSLEGVSYDIGDVRVVEDVSLELRDGEIVCMLGPSGSGKSTILRMLAGLTQPSYGKALYKDRPFTGTNPGASIVFQTFALYPWLTVLENVELGLSDEASKNREFRRARAMRAIDTIGLDGYENAYPRELSGGMRQRVGFARALAVEPELLCMDEPFSALDVLTAENLRTELLRLWQAGDVPTTSVLIVTHGIEEAVSLADRIIILGRDPGYVRVELPINMPHPRNRKSERFQMITDLVYTMLAEKDYVISEEDLRMLSNQYYVPSSARTPGSLEGMPYSAPRVSNGVPGRSEQLSDRIELDRLSLSEPLTPVDLNFDENFSPVDASAERYPQLPAVRIGSVGGLLSFIAEEPIDLYVLGQQLQLDVDALYPLIDAAEILDLIDVDEGHVMLKSKGQRFIDSSIDERKSMVRNAALSAPGARLISHIHCLLTQAVNQRLPQELIFDTVLLKHFSPVEARRQIEIAIEWGRFAELFGYEALTGTLFLDTGEDLSQI